MCVLYGLQAAPATRRERSSLAFGSACLCFIIYPSQFFSYEGLIPVQAKKKKKKAWWKEDLLASKNFLKEDVYAHKIHPAYFSTIWTKREKNTLPEREKVAETGKH